jgi:hypothetical protein
MKALLAAFGCLVALALQHAHAQGIATGDMEIFQIAAGEGGGKYACKLVIRNVSDDTARNVGVIVLLPNHVKVIATSKECVAGAPAAGLMWNAFVTCKYPTIDNESTCIAGRTVPPEECRRRARRGIFVETTPPDAAAARYPKICSAFVWNATGDHVRTNNFKASPPP